MIQPHAMRRSMRCLSLSVLVAAAALAAAPRPASAARFKELVTVEGVRDNALTGFGIVVGLDASGDDARSPVVRRSLAKMLKRLGVTIDASEIKAKNVAAVIVTATLPAFGRAGMSIDITISSMGSAKSLQGGTLIATPLKGADGGTYAIAQGSLSVGGFAADGATGSSKKKNHVTAGNIPGGATVEADAPSPLPGDEIVLLLREPDFTTASRIAASIDASLGADTAIVRDAGAVIVPIDPRWRKRVVQMIAALEALEAEPDAVAKVIIDERTGTVVVGEHVTLGKASIASGGLTVEIHESLAASQPGLLSEGETVVTPATDVVVDEGAGQLQTMGGAATVADVAAALNALGAKPRDLVSIFRALAAAGALHATIEVL